MSGNKIFIPELWEPKTGENLDNYAQKSELNNFILKNTNINMNNHTIENVKNSGNNDAVNKLYVDTQISSVNSQVNLVRGNLPYMTFIKESVSGSETAVKIIPKSIEDPVFIGLKAENVLLIPRVEHSSNEIPLNPNAKVISINNNILNINIRIENKWKQGWEIPVVVYVYIIIVYQKHVVNDIQNDQPQPDRSLNELGDSNLYKHMAKSYF